jgi:hypothetical protein
LAIYCRAVAFRFSSKGLPQVVDWTTLYDQPAYRMIDLLGKAKEAKVAFRLLPADMERPTEDGTWAKYPFDEYTSLWINTQHNEALTWYAAILNREKKGIDFAQTFARRNAIKHLLGIQKVPPEYAFGPEGKNEQCSWTIPVLCWRPVSGSIIKWDMTQYSQLQERVDQIIRGPGKFIEDKKVKLIAGTEKVSDDTLGSGSIDHEDAGADAGEEQAVDLADVIDVAHEDVGGKVADAPVTPVAPVANGKPAADVAPQPEVKQPPLAQAPKEGKKEKASKEKAPEQTTTEPELTTEEKAIMQNWRMACKGFPFEAFQALEQEGIRPQSSAAMADVTPAIAEKLLAITSRLVDAAQE